MAAEKTRPPSGFERGGTQNVKDPENRSIPIMHLRSIYEIFYPEHLRAISKKL